MPALWHFGHVLLFLDRLDEMLLLVVCVVVQLERVDISVRKAGVPIVFTFVQH